MTQRWLKLDERFPFTQTPIRLREKFGNEGLLVWVCMLTAAKRGTPEGTIEYVNEDHFWTKLGLHHSRPSFTSTEFLRYTGQLHLTRKRRSGDVETTEIRAWHDWQAEWRRDDDRERKSRKRRETEADTLRTRNGHPADKKRTETETETETEKQTLVGKGTRSEQKQTFHDPRSRRSDRTSRYTGCRQTRGPGGFGYERDPLGIDFPPKDWPHPEPSNQEILDALRAKDQQAVGMSRLGDG